MTFPFPLKLKNKSSHLVMAEMSTESAVVAAYFLRLQQQDLSFESALEIIKKEFAEKGAFVREDIFITSATGGNKEKCLGCKRDKVVYGDSMMKVCAKCMLPKEIYEKYLARPIPIKIHNENNPELLNKLQQQLLLLSKK
jgi:hypothetical protein